jgi:hypothetical protein
VALRAFLRFLAKRFAKVSAALLGEGADFWQIDLPENCVLS